MGGRPKRFPAAFALAIPECVRSSSKSRSNSATAEITCIVIFPAGLVKLLHVIEKDSTPVVSDLTGTLGIDSQQLLTDELVEIEGQRNRLLMVQGKAILESCAELL